MRDPVDKRFRTRYLLIVACSQRKRPDPGPMPAIERYDGVNFRVIAKAKREGYWPDSLDLLIVSAKYGLLRPDTLIEAYDQRMTRERAKQLQAQISAGLDDYLLGAYYDQVFVNLGKVYEITLQASSEFRMLNHRVVHAHGGIGEKMSHMKKWLRRKSKGR